MFRFSVRGVGLTAPGLPDWRSAVPVLRGEKGYIYSPLEKSVPLLLPANERRRVAPISKLGLAVAHEATAGLTDFAGPDAAVFSSSSSDLEMSHRICTAAGLPEHPISPTDFHNSVHNAASGYWSIATQSQVPTTSISAGQDSFSAGLLESLVMLGEVGGTVLFVCYEWYPSAPFGPATPLKSSAAVALLLEAKGDDWQVDIKSNVKPETLAGSTPMERLRHENPAMRAIPFLERLSGVSGDVVLPYVNESTFSIRDIR